MAEVTLTEFIDRWETQVLSLKKPSTVASMQGHLSYIRSRFSSFSELTYPRIQSFATDLAKSKSPKTTKNYWATFHLLLAQAQREGLVSDYPKPVLPKAVRPEQEWLTADQMKKIISCSEEPYATFLYLLAETGMRIGEAVGLKWGDINGLTCNISRSVYQGRAGTPKTSSSYRSLGVSNLLSCKLAGWRKFCDSSPDSWIFGTSNQTPWWPRELYTRRLLPNYGWCGIKPVGFHAWRRGNITMCANIGVPEAVIAQRVGHKIPTITLGVYCQKVEDKEWVEKISSILQ